MRTQVVAKRQLILQLPAIWQADVEVVSSFAVWDRECLAARNAKIAFMSIAAALERPDRGGELRGVAQLDKEINNRLSG